MSVAKYNIFKSVSTVLTIGAPIITLACCSDFFVQNTGTSISAAGVFALLIAALIFKDKMAEHFKMPSAMVIAGISLILIIMVEQILLPIKIVCMVTLISGGIDKLTFERLYKAQEMLLPEQAKAFKFAGFMFTTTKKLNNLKQVNGGNNVKES